jgi:hypothetical protein
MKISAPPNKIAEKHPKAILGHVYRANTNELFICIREENKRLFSLVTGKIYAPYSTFGDPDLQWTDVTDEVRVVYE